MNFPPESISAAKYIYLLQKHIACTLTMNTIIFAYHIAYRHHYPGSKQSDTRNTITFITFFNKPIIRLTFLTETHTLVEFLVCGDAFMYCV